MSANKNKRTHEKQHSAKERDAENDNVVRVSASHGQDKNNIQRAVDIVAKHSCVVISGVGSAVSNAVSVAESVKQQLGGLHQTTDVGTRPHDGGRGAVAAIRITLSTKQLDKKHVGYQPPLVARPQTGPKAATTTRAQNNRKGEGEKKSTKKSRQPNKQAADEYGDPSLFDVNSEIGIFDLEDAIIEYLAPTAANHMAIKSLSRSWRWGALTAFHWEGAIFCKCGKHMLLNPTKLQKPNAEKDAWCCEAFNYRSFCTCNIPKCLKNDDELQEQIGGYPAFEFLAIDFGEFHKDELRADEAEFSPSVAASRRRQPNINNVYFDSWPQDDVVAVRFLRECNPNKDKEINNKLLERFGPHNLRLFVAARAPVASSVLKKCGKLKWLDLHTAHEHVTAETMSSMAKLAQLKHLSLRGCVKTPQNSFKLLLRDNTSIENLSLSGRVATGAVLETVSHMPNLLSIDFSSNSISQKAVTSLATNATRLDALNVGWIPNMTQAAMSAFTNMSTLRSLDIRPHGMRRGYAATDSDVTRIAKNLARLEILKLSCMSVDDPGIAALGELRALRALAMENVEGNVTSLTLNGALRNLVQLRDLEIGGSRLKDEHLEFLEKLANLESFSFTYCSDVGDETLLRLGSSCRRLKKLDSSCCRVATSNGVGHLSQLTEIEVLELGHKQADDQALQHIGCMTNLRFLTLRDCDNNVTDNGLRYLCHLKELVHLDMDADCCNVITPTGVVRCIEKMNKLKFFRLKGTSPDEPENLDDIMQAATRSAQGKNITVVFDEFTF